MGTAVVSKKFTQLLAAAKSDRLVDNKEIKKLRTEALSQANAAPVKSSANRAARDVFETLLPLAKDQKASSYLKATVRRFDERAAVEAAVEKLPGKIAALGADKLPDDLKRIDPSSYRMKLYNSGQPFLSGTYRARPGEDKYAAHERVNTALRTFLAKTPGLTPYRDIFISVEVQ